MDPAASPAVSLPAVADHVAAGSGHTCAIVVPGNVYCWGANNAGELGTTASDIPELSPVLVTGLPGLANAVAAGGSHTCVATAPDNRVTCFGLDNFAQLGDGSLTGATAIAAGDEHTCALVGGAVRCWGINAEGELGDGSTQSTAAPVAVSGLTTAIAIAAGGHHTCALTMSGDVRCWGRNDSGQLGPSTAATYSATPVLVTMSARAGALGAGFSHTCAVLNTADDGPGGVVCWGSNDRGQLGDGSRTSASVPVTVVPP
jgi:alpha-tubulin suppressor-like RCC1 family protein